MENTTFNITDYTVMADSALQMNDTMNTSSLSLEEIGTTFASLFDHSIFDGPIAVDCKEKQELIIEIGNLERLQKRVEGSDMWFDIQAKLENLNYKLDYLNGFYD